LFDVNYETNLEEKNENSSGVSFDNKIDDIQTVLQPTELAVDDSDTELIKSAIKLATSDSGSENENTDIFEEDGEPDAFEDDEDGEEEIPGDVIASVEKDIENFDKQIENDPEPESDDILDEKPIQNSSKNTKNDNPLGLSEDGLHSYHLIQQRYPNYFNLYDGTLVYRDFYRFKVATLWHLLTQWPLLDIRDLRDELSQVQTNHYIGEDVPTPELIRIKMDACYYNRDRLCTLLAQVYEQYYAWERHTELLKSKLWKDHEIKGAHRRDGMVLEHISDMEKYVAGLKGFMESAKHYDTMLKAAADSLSRQLTCIQINEYTGSQRIEPDKKPARASFDSLDSVDDGTVISAPNPKPNSAVMEVNYGQEDDDFSQIG